MRKQMLLLYLHATTTSPSDPGLLHGLCDSVSMHVVTFQQYPIKLTPRCFDETSHPALTEAVFQTFYYLLQKKTQKRSN